MAMCEVADCDRPAARGGLCWTHQKRRARGRPLAPPVVERHDSSADRVWEAALAAADADSEDDGAFERARDRLRKAIEADKLARPPPVCELPTDYLVRCALELVRRNGSDS